MRLLQCSRGETHDHLGKDKGKLPLVCGLVAEKMTAIPDRSLSVEGVNNQATLWGRMKLERQ